MLTKIQIKDGVGSVERTGRHIKLVSAESQLQIEALSAGGKVLIKTEMRSPMAIALEKDAVRLNFYGADQLIEIWYSDFPLDYMQLVSISATQAKITSHIVGSGETQLTTKQANRKSVKVKPIGGNVFIGQSGQRSEGWLIPDGQSEIFETMGDLSVYRTMADIQLQGVAPATALPTVTLAGSLSSYGYAHFKGHHYVGLASVGYRIRDTDQQVQTIAAGVYFTFAGRLYRAGSGASAFLAVSDDGELWQVIAVNTLGGPQMQKINGRYGSVFTTISQGGWFYQLDPSREEVNVLAAIDSGFRPYVTAAAGIFGLMAGTGAGKGLFKRNPDGSWTQTYFNTGSTTEMQKICVNPQTGRLIAIINGTARWSDDGVTFTQISATSIGANNNEYVYFGGDGFLSWSGTLKHFSQVGSGYFEQTATMWTAETFPCDVSIDLDLNLAFLGDQSGSTSKRFKSVAIPGIAAAEPIRVQTLELLF